MYDPSFDFIEIVPGQPENQGNKIFTFLTMSNIDSGIQFMKNVNSGKDPVAAIVPVSFAEENKKWLHSSGIQDYKNNTTRFLVVRSSHSNEGIDFSRKKT